MDASLNEAAASQNEAATNNEAAASRRTPIDNAASRRQGNTNPIISSSPQRNSPNWRVPAAALLVITIILAACKPTSTLNRFQKQIATADTLWACEIDGYQTLPAEHKQGIRYIFDYEVKKVRPLLSTEVADIKAALLDSTTYDNTNVKSCPMVAHWAIAVRNHGKSPVAMVLSPSPCGKALVFDQKQADKPLNLELREGNRLEALVRKMW